MITGAHTQHLGRDKMVSKAIFTLQHNERYFLPMWIKYYSQFFKPEDMHILSHNCDDPVTLEILEQAEKDGYRVYHLKTDVIFDHDWLLNTIQGHQRELLKSREYVVFTDCDEFLVPTDMDLGQFIDSLVISPEYRKPAVRAKGHDVIEDKMYLSHGFDKTLISSVPLIWVHGYHETIPPFDYAPNLHLYHLHKLSYKECYERNQRLSKEKWDDFAVANDLSKQNRVAEDKDFHEMFYATGTLTEQDEHLKALLDYLR